MNPGCFAPGHLRTPQNPPGFLLALPTTVPVDTGQYEFYIFGNADGTPAQKDRTGPAVEFNWGARSRIQLHAGFPENYAYSGIHRTPGQGPPAVTVLARQARGHR